jgi:hypothetical protein
LVLQSAKMYRPGAPGFRAALERTRVALHELVEKHSNDDTVTRARAPRVLSLVADRGERASHQDAARGSTTRRPGRAALEEHDARHDVVGDEEEGR